MANAALAAPNLLTDPGYLYWAPLGTALPTGVSTASAFSDTWPAGWVQLGMTEAGTDIDLTITASPITAAEIIEPLTYRTTARTGTLTFALKNFTATNWARAVNGAVTTVTGTAGSTITQIDPPPIGQEVRSMIGFESLDNTFRFIAFQVFNEGAMKFVFKKAPSNTNVSWKCMLEKPASTGPWRAFTAGTARA
ncbi:MAG: hypothetical protein NVSMB4_02340 [Acidimicrobiales bacterium]